MADGLYRQAIERLRQTLERARTTSLREPTAMTLATAGADGRVSARVVLLRGIDECGLVFFTQSISDKGRQLEANARAALCLYWEPLGEQVRVEGRVELVTAEETDAYWRTRARESRVGAWASLQSAALDRRETLERRYVEFDRRYPGEDVPRPDRWVGYRVVPDRIEFWSNRPHRLHERVVYELADGAWSAGLRYP